MFILKINFKIEVMVQKRNVTYLTVSPFKIFEFEIIIFIINSLFYLFLDVRKCSFLIKMINVTNKNSVLIYERVLVSFKRDVTKL